jgi:hypothetical protein
MRATTAILTAIAAPRPAREDSDGMELDELVRFAVGRTATSLAEKAVELGDVVNLSEKSEVSRNVCRGLMRR